MKLKHIPPSADVALRLGILAAHVESFVMDGLTAAGQDEGLDFTQLAVLYRLCRMDRPVSAGYIRNFLYSGTNIHYTLDKLEHGGLIERHKSSEDKRSVEVVVTSHGLEVARWAQPWFEEVEKRLNAFSTEFYGHLVMELRMIGFSPKNAQS